MTRLARLLGSSAALACSSALVTVPTGAPPPSAPRVRVDYPPPPAKVEEISVGAGHGQCVWRDGYWDWTGRRWDWQAGRAVLAPRGCYHSRPVLERSADSLSFSRPAWYPQAGGPSSCSEIPCISNSDTKPREP